MKETVAQNVPPLAGVCTYADAARVGLGVEECVSRLKRLGYVKRRLMELLTARLPGTPEWEVKGAFSLHLYLDTEHASALRERVAEMRMPPLNLDQVPEPALGVLLDEAAEADDTLELLAGVYGVLRPALRDAFARHRMETNPLADYPTCRILRLAILEEEEMIAWGEQALAALTVTDEERRRAREWQEHLRAFLAAAGGILGDEPRATDVPGSRREASGVRRESAGSENEGDTPGTRDRRPEAQHSGSLSLLPRRDARFRGLFDTRIPADLIYLDETRDMAERNLALLFKRLREMDVPEMMAAIMAETRGKPWAYSRDMARQLWDEARHSMMGEVALARRGFDWTKLPVNITFSYKLTKFLTPLERHILLYAIEHSLMPRQQGKRLEWEIACASGDALSRTFHDFDWADEVLHVQIGRRCLLPDVPGGVEEVLRRAAALWSRLGECLEREPFPAEDDPGDWWQPFAEAVLGRPLPAPPDVARNADWRPATA